MATKLKSMHVAVGVMFVAILSGCASSAPKTHEGLLATLYVQQAAEFEAVSLQVYRSAGEHLIRALDDPSWTAALEQQGADLGELPPALIVDVDETVLDNSPYQARLVEDDEAYSQKSWDAWVMEAGARALPGAQEFLNRAASLGVTVFYVTNRAAYLEDATRRNLVSEGLPVEELHDVLLHSGENNWTSDKSARRTVIAEAFRILLLMGDDLNDFVPGARTGDPASRKELALEHAAKWGTRWFMLPNPTYGSWEASLYGRDYSLENAEKLRRKYDLLETGRQ